MLHAIMVTLKHHSEAVSQPFESLRNGLKWRVTSPERALCVGLHLGQATDLGAGWSTLEILLAWTTSSQPAPSQPAVEGWMTSSYSKVGVYAE
jgi:hypothetical protein